MRRGLQSSILVLVAGVFLATSVLGRSGGGATSAREAGLSATAPVSLPTTTAAQDGIDPCEGKQEESTDAYRTCWAAEFESVAAEKGAAAGLAAIQERGREFPLVQTWCHDFDHSMGRWAYENQRDVVAALADDDRACQYGYLHGVMEAYARDVSDEQMRAQLGSLCDPRRATSSQPGFERDLGECMHGIGHAAAVRTPDDVFRAVQWCHTAGGKLQEDLDSCAGGVLMEYGNSYVKKKLGTGPVAQEHGPGDSTISDDDASALCERIDGPFRAQCFRRVSMFWGPQDGSTLKGMLERCRDEAGAYVKRCAMSVGEWSMRKGYEAAQTDDAVGAFIATECLAVASLQGPCLSGAVYSITGNQIWSDVPVEQWMPLCELAASDQAKQTCRRTELQAIKAVPDLDRRFDIGRRRGFSDAELKAPQVTGDD